MCAFAVGASQPSQRDSEPPRDSPTDQVAAPSRLAELASRGAPNKAYSPIVLGGLVRLIEFLLLAAVGFAVHEVHVAPMWGHDMAYAIVIPGMSLLAVISLQALGLHHVSALRAPALHGLKILSGWTLVFVGALALQFFLKLDGQFSRVWLAGWYLFGLAALMAERFTLAAFVRALTRQGKLDRRTAIVGGGPSAEPVLRALAAQDDGDLRILGVFDDRSDARSPDVVAGFPKLGSVDELVEFARRTRLDLVIFTLPISAEERLLQMLRKLWVLPVDIRLAAHSNKLRFRPRSYSYIGDMPVIDIFDKPIADWDVFVKAAFDKIVGALCLIALSPVMLAVAIAREARLARAGVVQTVAIRLQQRENRSLQIPLHVCRSARRGGPAPRHEERSARDPRWPLHPQNLARRIAAIVQRRVQGRSVPGRAAPTCDARPRGGSPLRRRGRRLFRAPPRQAGHNRLGAGQWLARRNRYARENSKARRIRP